MRPNHRVGQVWGVNGSIELIIGWIENNEHVHLTLVLDSKLVHKRGCFDLVSDRNLANAEERTVESNWERIA